MSLRYDATEPIEFTQHFYEECVQCATRVRDDEGEYCVNCGQWVCDKCWERHKGWCCKH